MSMGKGQVTARQSLRHRPGPARAALPWVLWGIGALAVAAALVAADRAWVRQQRVDSTDPGVRVAGAVRSISGSNSVRRAEYNGTAKVAQADVTSRYYDAAKPANENREYLATEGRLAAQLALFGNTAVGEVTIRLYARRTLLATVTARQGQTYEEMKVEYSGPLALP
jgi:hypothetical protein